MSLRAQAHELVVVARRLGVADVERGRRAVPASSAPASVVAGGVVGGDVGGASVGGGSSGAGRRSPACRVGGRRSSSASAVSGRDEALGRLRGDPGIAAAGREQASPTTARRRRATATPSPRRSVRAGCARGRATVPRSTPAPYVGLRARQLLAQLVDLAALAGHHRLGHRAHLGQVWRPRRRPRPCGRHPRGGRPSGRRTARRPPRPLDAGRAARAARRWPCPASRPASSACPSSAIASSVSAASGWPMSRSIWIIRPISMFCPTRMLRAIGAQPGIGVVEAEEDQRHLHRLLVVDAHVVEEADVDLVAALGRRRRRGSASRPSRR